MGIGILVVAAVLVLLAASTRIVTPTTHVVDGDTLTVGGVKWRMAGYDAPEWNQPGGRDAAAALRRILSEGRCLAILGDADAYGRPVARIITRRGPLAWRMTLAGHAHGEGFVGRALTSYAAFRRRGLWATTGIVVSPRAWRQGIRL